MAEYNYLTDEELDKELCKTVPSYNNLPEFRKVNIRQEERARRIKQKESADRKEAVVEFKEEVKANLEDFFADAIMWALKISVIAFTIWYLYYNLNR